MLWYAQASVAPPSTSVVQSFQAKHRCMHQAARTGLTWLPVEQAAHHFGTGLPSTGLACPVPSYALGYWANCYLAWGLVLTATGAHLVRSYCKVVRSLALHASTTIE